MVKLSDALRGAADRAPLDGVTISTHAAARRVSLHRGLRGTATGIVGATAIGVIALGVIGPNGISSKQQGVDDGSMTAAAEAAPSLQDSGAGLDSSAGSQNLASGTRLAFGLCGQQLETTIPAMAVDNPVSLELEAPAQVDPGGSIPATVNATILQHMRPGDENVEPAVGPRQVVTTAPSAYVTWDGITVASVPAESIYAYGPADEQLPNPNADLTVFAGAPGESQSFAVDMPLNNCWDGAPLPAGKYELFVTQGFYESADASNATPEPVPSETSTAATRSGGPTTSADEILAADGTYYEVNATTGFAITGDQVDDPFAQYLGEPQPPVEPSTEPTVDPPTDGPPPVSLPDGSLTPGVARQLYAAGLTNAPWDMAAGTQRWLLTNDSLVLYDDAVPYDENAWAESYFGCAMEGQTNGRFPSRSAQLDLLDVGGEFPTRIGVSYGWVVDGNPTFALTARNVSDYTLNNFASPLNSQLYLLKDGVVVAEAYGVNPAQNGGAVMFSATDNAVLGGIESRNMYKIVSPDAYQVPALVPGASVDSTFLWRDINGCWQGERQATITPGVYTLVSSQYVPVGSSQVYYEEQGIQPQSGINEELVDPFGGDSSAVAPNIAVDPAPAPGQFDSVDLQVWTSFGSITVS